jgi:hypothetical protein
LTTDDEAACLARLEHRSGSDQRGCAICGFRLRFIKWDACCAVSDPALSTIQITDIVRAGGWHSALFTTFSLSLSFFEAVALQALRDAGVRRTSIVVDVEGYRASLSERGVSEVGRIYDVVPLAMDNGIFHPKLMLLHGEAGIRATIGSGNLTFRGWGRNIEVIEYLHPEIEPEAFADLSDFLTLLALEATSSNGRISAERNPVPDDLIAACSRAGRARPTQAGRARVLHTLERSIVDQLRGFAADRGGATAITVVSPFFHGSGAVVDLARRLNCDNVSVCVPRHAPEWFDFAAARSAGLEVRPVEADAFNDANRSLHGKVIEISCHRGRLSLAGSVNATWPALASVKNVELAVLRSTDEPTVIGWRKCDLPAPSTALEVEPEVGPQPCLVARFDGAQIAGRVFGARASAAPWCATLDGVAIAAAVVVDSDGSFGFSARVDLLKLGRAVQLVFKRDAEEAAGWLIMDQILEAVRERGRTAEAVARILAGAGDADDIAAMLAFFADNPEALLFDRDLTSGGGSDTAKIPGASGTVDVSHLRPVDAFDAKIGAGGGGSLGAFDRLLAALRRAVVGHDESSLAASARLVLVDPRADDPDAPPPRTVPNQRLDAVFDALLARATQPSHSARQVVFTALAFLRFVSGTADDPEALIHSGLSRWQEVARAVGGATAPPDDLDKAYVAAIVARVVAEPRLAAGVHEALQAWHGGFVPPEWAENVVPRSTAAIESWLAPDAGEAAWDEAWRAVLQSETRWAWANAVSRALDAGNALPGMPASLRPTEATTIADVARGARRRDRVLVVPSGDRVDACPRCHLVLPEGDRQRLRHERVATAPCCERVLLSTGFRR